IWRRTARCRRTWGSRTPRDGTALPRGVRRSWPFDPPGVAARIRAAGEVTRGVRSYPPSWSTPATRVASGPTWSGSVAAQGDDAPRRLHGTEWPGTRHESVDARQRAAHGKGADELLPTILQGVHRHHEGQRQHPEHGDHRLS